MFGKFKILKKCSTTNARVSEFQLNYNTLHTPIFMPVATYGAMRGVPVSTMPEEMILSNTYHLRNLKRNVKDFMQWKKSMLTDSGGFQIQSLPNVEVTDEGVIFEGKLFKPEDSMDIQMELGADIMMQLDDVVNPTEERWKHEKAVDRSLEWLERAIRHINEESDDLVGDNLIDRNSIANDLIENKVTDKIQNDESSPLLKRHKKDENNSTIKKNQILFPIIQGGLLEDLRLKSINGILKHNPVGLAIGGLSGGEDKQEFARTVLFCCKNLPDNIPRYLMGVGYPEDIVVCCALGTDMSDCVYPTRTARFGKALRDKGDIMIGNKTVMDKEPIDTECSCETCKKYSKAFLSTIKGTSNFCMLMTVHNMHYMRGLTERIRKAIFEDRYPEFIKEYMKMRFGEEVPAWIKSTLKSVNVHLE